MSEAKHGCRVACDLTDVHIALRFLQMLLARERSANEDDADICLGVGAIIGLFEESLVRREDAAGDAFLAMFEAFDRERGL